MKRYKLIRRIKRDNDIIDDLYYGKEEELAIFEDIVKRELRARNIDTDKNFYKLQQIIKDNISLSEKDKKDILNEFNNFFEEEVYKNSLIAERYYKQGVRDGMNLLLTGMKHS